jgi:hypothetical protein
MVQLLPSLKMPLKNGEIVDVVLGFTLEAYIKSFDLEVRLLWSNHRKICRKNKRQ